MHCRSQFENLMAVLDHEKESDAGNFQLRLEVPCVNPEI